MKLFPIHFLLEGRTALIVGGGGAAAAKAKSLLQAAAVVRIIAPETSPELNELVDSYGVSVNVREFTPSDLEGAWIVIAATDRPEVNRAIFEEAERRRIPVCSVDDPSRSSFIVPAVLRRGDLVLTVSTSGRAPALAVRIRDYLGEIFTEEYAHLLDRLDGLRQRFRREYPDFDRRREAWYRLIDASIIPALRQRRPVDISHTEQQDGGASPSVERPATESDPSAGKEGER